MTEIVDHVLECVASNDYVFTEDTGQLAISCPSCEDRGHHFYVNIDKYLYHCFKCDKGGSIRSTIGNSKILRSRWAGLRAELVSVTAPIRCYGEESLVSIIQVLEHNPANLREGYQQCPLLLSLASKAHEYCVKRGLSRGQIAQYAVSVKSFENRVFFPCWNEKDELVYYTGRKLDDNNDDPKTLEMVSSSKPLFGRHVHKWHDFAVLVEGVFDHFATPHSYAVMGSTVTELQMDQLRSDHVNRVFVLFDPDATRSSETAVKKLVRRRFKAYPVVMGGGKDPADLGWSEMAKIAEQLETVQYRRTQTIRVG